MMYRTIIEMKMLVIKQPKYCNKQMSMSIKKQLIMIRIKITLNNDKTSIIKSHISNDNFNKEGICSTDLRSLNYNCWFVATPFIP